MRIDLTNSFQCEALYATASLKLFAKASEWSISYTNTMRLVGPLLVMGDALIKTAFKVVGAVEAVIKGIVNIVGSPFSEKCSALRGCKMLTLNLLGDGMQLAMLSLMVILSPINMIFAVFTPTNCLQLFKSQLKEHVDYYTKGIHPLSWKATYEKGNALLGI